MLDNVCTCFFDISFWQQLLTTFIGAGLAIPTGIWIDRFIKNKQNKQERLQLIIALKEVLEKNTIFLKDLDTNLNNSEYLPLFAVDLFLLDSTSLKKYESLDSIQVCKMIDHARSTLRDIDEQLALMRHMLADASRSALVRAEFDRVRSICKSQVIVSREAIAPALAALQRLEKQ